MLLLYVRSIPIGFERWLAPGPEGWISNHLNQITSRWLWKWIHGVAAAAGWSGLQAGPCMTWVSCAAHHLCHPGQKPSHCWPCDQPGGLCLEGSFGLSCRRHHTQAKGCMEIMERYSYNNIILLASPSSLNWEVYQQAPMILWSVPHHS